MSKPFPLIALALSLSLFAAQSVKAEDETPANQVHFQVSLSQTVDNDRLDVSFYKLVQAPSPQEVTKQIDQAMHQALKAIDLKSDDYVVQTGQYSLNPNYDKNRIISHWQGRQQLNIHFKNPAQATQIISKLTPYLSYSSMQFSASEQTRRQAQDALLKDAIQAFRHKAQWISEQFAAEHYRIVETNINTPSRAPVYAYARVAMEKADSAPALAAGESQIQVQINGKLELY
ncbi:SIMPL domain-containing protein [Thiomicrorhabdus heinhorstiae]|uniref:SIMPL domain-containing protein n=1 Tax=Thiomicrorhabdus heinhorstiae TaxID=2748010 RepID=A0ABS0BYR8_9GAMM|nr:SIMPL domain-containing protein [Thiomicrorhabdus heinhorstiae]MBF6058947.1 SIMPL domain-containing protein [Thiomicrorhabdus heinhorstiae]